MEPTSPKFYQLDENNLHVYLTSCFSPTTLNEFLEEALRKPMTFLSNAFSSGQIKGDHLIDLSAGPIIFPLIPIFEYFIEITTLRLNDNCVKELNKWIQSDEDAFDWRVAFKYMMELEGNSEGWEAKEETLKKSINHVLKCDLSKESLVDTDLVPKADCLFTAWILDSVSDDKTSYRQNLKKISSLIKPGGHLVMIADINASWFSVGGRKFHILSYDEVFLKNALKDEGYSIKCYETVERDIDNGFCDYWKLAYVIACKEREV